MSTDTDPTTWTPTPGESALVVHASTGFGFEYHATPVVIVRVTTTQVAIEGYADRTERAAAAAIMRKVVADAAAHLDATTHTPIEEI